MPLPDSDPGPGRLRDQVRAADASRFTGRADVLTAIARRWTAPSSGGVIFVHGPAGIGKSALLRELHRRASADGVASVYAHAGEVDATLIAGAAVVLIDSFDDLEVDVARLRDETLADLPAETLVVIASRTRPPASWFRDGWEHVVSEVWLRALSRGESAELLNRHEVDEASVGSTVEWARGLPLALHVAATQVGDTPAVDLAAAIAHRLVGDDLGDLDMPVLAIAAISRDVTPELISSLLPGRDISGGLAQLRRLSTQGAFAAAMTMPEVLRDALRTELRRRDAAGYRQLVVRIADRLFERVTDGEYWLMDGLTALIEDPAVRWGYTKQLSSAFSVSTPSPGDAREAAHALKAVDTRWWRGVERFFTDAPQTVTVVRDRAEALVGFSIVATTANAPAWVDADRVLGPSLAHARRHGADDDAIFFRDSFDLTDRTGRNAASPVVALLNSPPQLADQLPYARHFYGIVDLANEPARELASAIGAVQVPELSVVDGERRLGTYVLDHGPGGVAGAVLRFVRAEQKLPLAIPARPVEVDEETVRLALRVFHDPVALAASPLAVGHDVATRAESVRALLRRTAATAFGASTSERQLRRLIEIGYLDAEGGHQRAMKSEHLSRSSYYRRLATAVERIAGALTQRT